MSEHNGSPSSIVVSFLFGFGFLVGLGNNGLPDSIALDGNQSHSDLPFLESLTLNTVVVGEVDELERDVG